MNHRDVASIIAKELLAEPGWTREHEYALRHMAASVHISVLPASIAVSFGHSGVQWHELAVSVSTRNSPANAIASVIEVVRALVITRTLERQRAAWAASVLLDKADPDDSA